MYIGLNTPRGTNKNPNRVPDLLTKVLPKALASWQGKPWQEGLGTRQRERALHVNLDRHQPHLLHHESINIHRLRHLYHQIDPQDTSAVTL